MEQDTTLDRILDAAKYEFLKKGFRDASLRNIVKTAGVTTGAFYGYFSSKEALFAAIVEPYASKVMERFVQAQDDFFQVDTKEQPQHLGVESADCLDWMIEYIYDNYDIFKILLCKSEGTPYMNFVHNMVEIEVDSTYRFMENLKSLGKTPQPIDRELCHMLVSGMFEGIFQSVEHDMPREKVKPYVRQIRLFYETGWQKLLGL